MEDLCNRMIINTPDVYLNALAMASVRAVDGCWYPPVFAHGAMQWNNNLPVGEYCSEEQCMDGMIGLLKKQNII